MGPSLILCLSSDKKIASTWAVAFDTLLDAYQQIGENIPLLGQYQAMFADNAYMQGILELIYKDILEFHRRALKFFKQRGPLRSFV